MVEQRSGSRNFAAVHQGDEQRVFEHLALGAAPAEACNVLYDWLHERHALCKVLVSKSRCRAAKSRNKRSGQMSASCDHVSQGFASTNDGCVIPHGGFDHCHMGVRKGVSGPWEGKAGETCKFLPAFLAYRMPVGVHAPEQ
jgi:RNase P protein component